MLRLSLEETDFASHCLDCPSDTESVFEGLLDEGQDARALKDIVEDLMTDVECLQELSPALERPSQDVGYEEEPRCINNDASILMKLPILPFAESIQQNFPQADPELVEHLAEKNFARYLRLHEQRRTNEQRDHSEVLQLDTQTVAPSSKFHDSGFGGSVAPTETHVPSVPPSVSSRLTVSKHLIYPSLTEDAKSGKPFVCTACGRTVSVQSARVWKQHLMSDLQPYVCIFPRCNFALNSNEGSTISAWAQHLDENHRPSKMKERRQCPLCSSVVLPARFIAHIGQHLENMALSVLPRECEPDSDLDDDRVGSEDTGVVEHRKTPPSGENTKQKVATQQRVGPSSYWSVSEVKNFPDQLAHFGTDWLAIANHMGTKTETMVHLKLNFFLVFINV